MALALALAAAVLIGSISVHAHAVATARSTDGASRIVRSANPGGARTIFRSRSAASAGGAGAVWRRAASNWYSGIAYELVGGAPVYAAAISGFHGEGYA